jgi:NitT/TauT family transport system permease protein
MSADVLTPVVDEPATAPAGSGPGRAAWAWIWPKGLAILLVLGTWQLIYLSGWRPDYVLPSPAETLQTLWGMLGTERFWSALQTTMIRAITGFALAVVIGTAIGVVVARIKPLRLAVGSLITGLQTMPSIAWFPLAILLFKLSEQAILFVVVIGAAPAIANGLIAGADNVPPLLIRAGRVLGARRVSLYRNVILPGSPPSFVAGTKQGWAFAWRSLMAGELLVIIANKPSIGTQLQVAREFSDAEMLLATMIVILMIGIFVDSVVFGRLERLIRSRWGLIDPAG